VVSAAAPELRERADVAVVGGGPAGLATATALARKGAGRVLVLDREPAMGGIPRHARHQGFGLRDLRRPMSGPRYAARNADLAANAGAELRTETQVTGWTDDGALWLTGPGGRSRLSARAVVLATGCRERPRPARLVPGSRPQGVMTTAMLQQLVYLRGRAPGRRAVVVGAEHVSFSALLTLAHGGAHAAAMITQHSRHQSFATFRAGAALRFRAPLLTRTELTAIQGRRRVEAVELAHLDTGEVRTVSCDLVVFTADWIPDHELAVLAGTALDPATRGPRVDSSLRTSRPGLFAAGNLLHGAETADVAALSGRHVAGSVIRHLAGEPWPTAGIPIVCEAPLLWIVPNAVAAQPAAGARPPRRRFLLRAAEAMIAPRIELAQDGRVLWSGRLARLVPGRSARLPDAWTGGVDEGGGPVRARIRVG
jgi:thioredoxin reductase